MHSLVYSIPTMCWSWHQPIVNGTEMKRLNFLIKIKINFGFVKNCGIVLHWVNHNHNHRFFFFFFFVGTRTRETLIRQEGPCMGKST